MSYLAQADLARDELLLHRATACAVSEGITHNPSVWVARRLWDLSATPGWAAAYAASDEYQQSTHRETETAPAVAHETIITDAMIRERVLELIEAGPLPDELRHRMPAASDE